MNINRIVPVVLGLAFVINVGQLLFDVSRGRLWLALFHFVMALMVAAVWRFFRRKMARVRAQTKLILDSLDAPRPEGVRVIRADGTVLSCELVYQGRGDDGQHLWYVAGVLLGPGDQLYADVLPAHTGIEFEQR